jgi:hypothetical protein
LYVLLDVFSRYVTGWMVTYRESAELAKRLIEESCKKQQIQPGQLTLHALYKNQRLTIETQNDAQFYEALKRFGDKDSAGLRSSAVGLLTDMTSRNIINRPVRPFGRADKVASKYFTVLNQLVAASRLEEHRVVLNSIKDAIEVLATSDPVSVMKVLYRATLTCKKT